MPIREYSSAAWTFSMSRLAIRLPMVARRSPAITTPSPQVIATMVVPCGATSAVRPGGSGRRPGSSSGAVRLRNSVNEETPGVVNAAGRRPDGSRPADTNSPSGVLSLVDRCWKRLSRARAREDQRGRMSAEGLLAALLDVPADELLGVLLQHGVDLVEQVV